MRILLILLGASLGSALASFASLVLARVPHRQSILWPASRCDACRRPLRLMENVPIVAYGLLGGRCATCRAPMSRFSFALEVIGALLGGLIVELLVA